MALVIINPNLQRGSHDTKVGTGETHWEWSPTHEAYIWQGRELTDEEHNKVVARIIKMSLQIAPWRNSPVFSKSISSNDEELKLECEKSKIYQEHMHANAMEMLVWKERAEQSIKYGDTCHQALDLAQAMIVTVSSERDALQSRIESLMSAQPVAVKKKCGPKPKHERSEEDQARMVANMNRARETRLANLREKKQAAVA